MCSVLLNHVTVTYVGRSVHVRLKFILYQGLSGPQFYDDLVHELKKSFCTNVFSAHFIKIISHYKRIGYIAIDCMLGSQLNHD